MTENQAHEWLTGRGKHPAQIIPDRFDPGESPWHWRWILPDPPSHDGPADLPDPVFSRLMGGDQKFPWLFRTEEDAMRAAVRAVVGAMASGWVPTAVAGDHR